MCHCKGGREGFLMGPVELVPRSLFTGTSVGKGPWAPASLDIWIIEGRLNAFVGISHNLKPWCLNFPGHRKYERTCDSVSVFFNILFIFSIWTKVQTTSMTEKEKNTISHFPTDNESNTKIPAVCFNDGTSLSYYNGSILHLRAWECLLQKHQHQGRRKYK